LRRKRQDNNKIGELPQTKWEIFCPFLKLFSSNESSAMKEMARSVGGSRELFQGLLSLAANEKNKTKQNTQKNGNQLKFFSFLFSLDLQVSTSSHI
jgi:hypothetical protein